MSDLQARLDEEIAAKNDALSKLSQKSAELDSIKEKYNRDVIARTAELEEAKKKVDKDLIEATAKLDDLILTLFFINSTIPAVNLDNVPHITELISH